MAKITGNKSLKSAINKTPLVEKARLFFKNREDVTLVFFFGSFVSGKMTAISDIDVGILFHSTPDIYKVNTIKDDLTALLKKDVDILVINDASPVIKMQVLKKGILIFQTDKNIYSTFYGDTVKQYDDLKQIRKKCEDNILKGRIYA